MITSFSSKLNIVRQREHIFVATLCYVTDAFLLLHSQRKLKDV